MYKRSLLGAAIAVPIVLALALPGQAASQKKPTPVSDLAVAGVAADANFSSDQAASVALDKKAATVSSKVRTFVAKSKTSRAAKAYTFASYADARTGKVVLETDAPATVAKTLLGTDASAVTVKKTAAATDHFSRRDDIPAFWGGDGITLEGQNPNPRCSSGYTVASGTTRYMVTAGHCYNNGQRAVTELGGRYYGTAYGNGLPSVDIEILYGASYSPYVFGGGVNGTTGYHVASAANPVVGFADYCHSGRTTGENCGHRVISITAQVCTSSGCKSPVMAFQGGVLPQGGDSGSPIYAKSAGTSTDKHIRGHVIAGNGTTEYGEMWSRVQARFGVAIAT